MLIELNILKNIALFSILSNCYCKSIQCRNHLGEPVDWYVLYKLPIINSKKNNYDEENRLVNSVKEGVAYAFMSSKECNRQSCRWQLSQFPITDIKSHVGWTLEPLYKDKRNTMIRLYNDQPPSNKTTRYGHTKGLVLGDENGGIWLVHSVPRFPDSDHYRYNYPKSGCTNGQSFLCISLDVKNMNKVATQIDYNEPYIYDENIPKHLKKVYTNYVMKTADEDTYKNLETIISLKGNAFKSFAKSAEFGKDLYHDWIAPNLKSNMLTATWLRSKKMESNCSGRYKVLNIKSIKFRFDDTDKFPDDVSFSNTKDHSKWAVSTSKSRKNKWICIGDINRGYGQTTRGGGSVCFNNEHVIKNYQKIVDETEECPKTHTKKQRSRQDHKLKTY